ncbi:MAG: hypothetical protein OEW19_03860 [Acidobacteriota bacterium]|nr:hypothetical protein [Acidobacteriota bacterium]
MIFELLFIVVLLGTVAATSYAGALALGRRWLHARRVIGLTAALVGTYLVVVVVVSFLTPRQWVAEGQEQRFDDWAVTVLQAHRLEGGYRVDLRVASHARGRPQRAADAQVLLVAADGRRFAPRAAPGERSLRSTLQPGESFVTTRTFDVPSDAAIIGLDVVHGAWPELFIIGDRGSLFHRRPLVRLAGGAQGGR